MSKLIETLKSQEEEFNLEFVDEDGGWHKTSPFDIKMFIKSYNAKIVNAVLDEVLGEKVTKEDVMEINDFYEGYNKRVIEEITKAQQLREEVEGK